MSANPTLALSDPALDSAAVAFTARGQSIIDDRPASKAKVRVSAANRFVVVDLEVDSALGKVDTCFVFDRGCAFDPCFAFETCFAFVRWFAQVSPVTTNAKFFPD